MSFSIRRQVPDDYPAIAALEGFPVEEVAAQEAGNPQFTGRVALREGKLIGRASAGFMPNSTPVGDQRCLVIVDPAERRQGVGAALFDELLEAVRLHRPANLRANGDPGRPDDLAWAERRGFAATQHLKFQALDLAGFDPAPWEAVVAASPFRFVPFDHLRSEGGERQLHAMFQEYLSHTPDAGESPYQPFEPWRQWALESAGAWPEGWIIAVAPDGSWAGFTMAQRDGGQAAHIFMSGVAPKYRGEGLGVALKAAATLHAQRSGITRLTTLNHAANVPILAINRKLGFQVAEEILRLVRPCSWH